VRGLDPTNGRVRLAAHAVFWLLTLLLATATARAGAPGEPIDLCARRVLAWEAGGHRWAILEGEASVLKGAEGVRAPVAVVRATPDPEAGPHGTLVEVYAEGGVLDVGESVRTHPRVRRMLRSAEGVRAGTHTGDPATGSTGPPASGRNLIARAFPTAPEVPIAAVRPEERPAPLVRLGPPIAAAEARTPAPTKVDVAVLRAQGPAEGFGDGLGDLPPLQPARPAAPAGGEAAASPAGENPSELPLLEPLPDALPELEKLPGVDVPVPPAQPEEAPFVPPILPGSQRTTRFFPRNGQYNWKRLATLPDGTSIIVCTGGVNIVVESPGRGTIDISADSVIVWTRDPDKKKRGQTVNPDQGLTQDDEQMLEFYMEGNVVLRQDERLVAGNGDQRTYQAAQAYYDVRKKRFLGKDAELDLFVPGLVAPLRTKAEQILQYSLFTTGPNGGQIPGSTLVRGDHGVTTGSRFANPGYRFTFKSFELSQTPIDQVDPITGKIVRKRSDGRGNGDQRSLIETRQNLFFLGPVPVFYWGRMVFDPDDPTPPLQNIRYQYGSYFGHQVLTDWNGFKLFGIKKPAANPRLTIDVWNVDIDYLSLRGPALGSEFAYFGDQLIPNIAGPHSGFLDVWGIRDHGFDVLGPGPAIVTNGPRPDSGIIPGAPFGPGRARYDRTHVPPFREYRYKFNFRHMQSFLMPDADPTEDFRVQIDAAYLTDRHFLEEYYKRSFDVGPDQDTLIYLIRQRENHAFTVLTQANLQNWYTQSQFLPKLDYFRLGDSLLGDRVTSYTNVGVDYDMLHTAVEVNNPNVFALLRRDPVSNTSGAFNAGRAYLSQEFDLPFLLGPLKVVPYAQGQLVGWTNQIYDNGPVGRVWGAVGGRASIEAYRKFTGGWTDSELFNVHGLNHKITFDIDARFAYANVNLNRLGIQDNLDDNTYEYVRRYFAMTSFAGAVLPPQYDPRFLTLRRAISPITGTTDVQGTIDTIQLAIRQRLQTKRGPEGRRRVIDYMTFDVSTIYYPNSSRDNFGKPFGQNMYNYEWFIGDRTSIVSSGWFEFFNITGGQALATANPQHSNDPFLFKVVTAGVNMSRPPRANLYTGYSIINTGPIHTSALVLSYSYLLSPKWYSSVSTMYDFGNQRLLAATFALTKIGADFLTSAGLTVDPQRQNYTFGLELSPRLSPNIRLGSASGLTRFDTRFAPTQ